MKNRFPLMRSGDMSGKLLVAAPSLQENAFEKTVVLVLQHNLNGTFGVVLNRPANEELLSAWESMTGRDAINQCVVHGGPIGGPVFAIHQHQAIGEVAMPGGLYVSTNSELLQKLTEQNDDRYRIVFGVASWAVGQLQEEINRGIWYPVTASADDVFDDADWMWEKSLRRYGRQTLCDILGINSLPANPNWN